MSERRDEFSQNTIRKLGDRVNWVCSNPDCGASTKGPHSRDDKAISVGMACHIHAAAPGGPRYDSEQTPEERAAIGNAIWLCRTCGTLIDTDEIRFPAPFLLLWKAKAEFAAFQRIGKPSAPVVVLSSCPRMSDAAIETMRYLGHEYIAARYPNHKVWGFTPNDDDDSCNELRALGLLYFGGPRGAPWQLTDDGVKWILAHRDEMFGPKTG